MNKISRLIILALLIFAAIACYVTGFGAGANAIIFLGVAFELAFWIKLYATKREKNR